MRVFLKRLLCAAVVVSITMSLTTVSGSFCKAETTKTLKLWYDEPAPTGNDGLDTNKWTGTVENDGWECWSLPIGNGYMGANVFGRTSTERIQITENSLVNPQSVGGLNNFCELYIDFNHDDVSNYYRDLVIDDAVAHVQYDYNGVTYTREYFTSYPDKVMVIKLDSDNDGSLSFVLRPTIPYLKNYGVSAGDNGGKTGTVTASGDTVTMSGVLNYYNVEFEGQYKVIPQGGTLTAAYGTISVENADSAVIIAAIGTNYELESRVFTESDRTKKLEPYAHPHDKVTGILTAAAAKSYEELKSAHMEDYHSYFNRVELDLGAAEPEITTDELLKAYQNGTENKYLEELYFQYGRYLLISSSRKGALPPNLQGVWNRYNNTPWSGGYWHNINVQMNFWPAFNTNLIEMFETYVDYNKAYMESAELIADEYIKNNYPENYSDGEAGSNGWSIGTGAWPYSIESPEIQAHSGPGTGEFTAKMFWDYYDFTRDEEILENVSFPVISSMAKFLSKTLIDKDEKRLVGISRSPEQSVKTDTGTAYYTSVGTAFDQQMVWEAFNDTIKGAEILGEDYSGDVSGLYEDVNRLDEVIVGASGQVKEYREENYYGEIGDKKHRHISNLVGLYPGTSINANTPAWLDAAKVTLTNRGDESTGWAMAHRLNLWARAKDAEHSYLIYNNLLKKGTLTNLWDTHPPFQIDGNFGGTAGVAEMLVQSHEGYIDVLPALPSAWADGSYSGLTARGDFEVSAQWASGKAEKIEVLSESGTELNLKYPGITNAKVTNSAGDNIEYTIVGKDIISFSTETGGLYTITDIPAVEKPSVPQSLTAENTFTQVNLSWTAAADAVSYNIYRAVESAPDYECIATGVEDVQCSFAVDEAAIGRQAVYKVCAVNSSGIESDGVTVVLTEMESPKNVTGVFVNDNTLSVSYDIVDGAEGYRIYEYTGGRYNCVSETSENTATVNNANKVGSYWVCAYAGTKESVLTEVKYVSFSINKLTHNLCIYGSLEEGKYTEGENVLVLLTKKDTVKSDISKDNISDYLGYAGHAVIEADGTYMCKFKFDTWEEADGIIDNYVLTVKTPQSLLNDSLIGVNESSTYIANLDISNSSGNELNLLTDELVMATVGITNFYDDEGTFKCIIGFYDSNDSLISTSVEDIAVAYKKTEQSVKADIPDNCVKVKCFLWKSFNTMVPLCDVAEKE